MAEFKFPTEEIELPSKGLVYPKDNPLSSGKVEIKYMTAKEEDILSNQAYIEKGNVLDKLLESVIISKIDLKDLIVGDKNAILIATRILGYGSDYKTTVNGRPETIDLSELENKEFDSSTMIEGKNEFAFTLPHSDTKITYKLLTGHDEAKIERELKGLKKLNKNSSPDASTRLKYVLTSVNGETEIKDIREFVDTYFLARDARAFRKHIVETSPDVDLNVILDSGEEVTVPIGLNFFGLTLETAPQVRLNIFKQIHEIIFHGKGGYDYITIYNMPIWLRKFTFKEINDFYTAKAAAEKNEMSAGKTSLVNSEGKVNAPQFKQASKAYEGKSSYK